MKRAVLAVLLVACGSKQGGTGSGTGTGTQPPTGPISDCTSARPKVEQLYRADAQAKEPKRVDEAVADNTQMVMKECAKDPAKVSACIAKATTTDDIEKQCLVPLDDEGTEGEGR